MTANYPTKKVILSYALLGGAVGGILMALILMIRSIGFYDNSQLFKGFFVWIALGAIIGFLPALLTGTIINQYRIRLISPKNYFQIALIGYLMTFPIFMVLPILMTDWSNGLAEFHLNFQEIVSFLKYSLVGAVSSLIVGKFALPKT